MESGTRLNGPFEAYKKFLFLYLIYFNYEGALFPRFLSPLPMNQRAEMTSAIPVFLTRVEFWGPSVASWWSQTLPRATSRRRVKPRSPSRGQVTGTTDPDYVICRRFLFLFAVRLDDLFINGQSRGSVAERSTRKFYWRFLLLSTEL